MFDQAAAPVTKREYPADYQEYLSYLREDLERGEPETWQEALLLFIE